IPMFSRHHKLEAAPVQVKLVTSDDALEARLRRDLGGDPRFGLHVLRSGLKGAAALPNVTGKSSIYVIDIDPTTLQEIAAAGTLVARSVRDVPVIVMSDNLGGEMARRLLRLQVSDWLPRTVDKRDFVQACERALTPRAANGHDQQAKCFAFYPAMGGVGN